MKKALLLLAAGLTMAACSEASTAPRSAKAATSRAHADDLVCPSGYTVAYDADGNAYCTPINP